MSEHLCTLSVASKTISNLTHNWNEHLRGWHLELFIISTVIVSLATLLANSVLLACIFLSRVLSQETRYLLLANALIADVLFLIFNLAKELCNATGTAMSWIACELVTAVTVTTYCCAIFSITFMVVDTYAAVRWPLHYREFLPPARTHRLLVCVWVFAAIYPFTLVILTAVGGWSRPYEKLDVCLVLISLGFINMENTVGNHVYFIVAAIVCALLIFYCYVRLYMVTRTQGIWQSRFSKARVTLLVHGILLVLYFSPGFVFSMELLLFHRDNISLDAQVWISAVNMSIFMLLPRVCAPFLYGLRYREIHETLTQMLLQQRRPSPITVS